MLFLQVCLLAKLVARSGYKDSMQGDPLCFQTNQLLLFSCLIHQCWIIYVPDKTEVGELICHFRGMSTHLLCYLKWPIGLEDFCTHIFLCEALSSCFGHAALLLSCCSLCHNLLGLFSALLCLHDVMLQDAHFVPADVSMKRRKSSFHLKCCKSAQ